MQAAPITTAVATQVALSNNSRSEGNLVAYLGRAATMETPPCLTAALGEIEPVTPLRRKSDQTAPVRLGHAVQAKAMLEARAVRDKIVLEAYAAWVTIESTPIADRTPGEEYFASLMDQYECKYALLYRQPDGQSTRVIKDQLVALARNEDPPERESQPKSPPQIVNVLSPTDWATALEKARLAAVLDAQSRPPPPGARKHSVRRPTVLHRPAAQRSAVLKSIIVKPPSSRRLSQNHYEDLNKCLSDTESILRNSMVGTAEVKGNAIVDALFDQPPACMAV